MSGVGGLFADDSGDRLRGDSGVRSRLWGRGDSVTGRRGCAVSGRVGASRSGVRNELSLSMEFCDPPCRLVEGVFPVTADR